MLLQALAHPDARRFRFFDGFIHRDAEGSLVLIETSRKSASAAWSGDVANGGVIRTVRRASAAIACATVPNG